MNLHSLIFTVPSRVARTSTRPTEGALEVLDPTGEVQGLVEGEGLGEHESGYGAAYGWTEAPGAILLLGVGD